MKLKNAKHEAFCLEYAKSANATESYRKVYKSKSSGQVLSQSASRLLKNEKVQTRLAELHEEMASEKIAGITEIQERLSRILRGEELEDVVVVEGVEKGVSEARIIQKKPSMNDIIKSGVELAKMQGSYNNNVNVNVSPIMFVEDLDE